MKNLYSDNGTNFCGANNELSELGEKMTKEYDDLVANELAQNGNMWPFSPPGSPHFNGLVEAGVKTIKTHIKREIGDTKLTFEEMTKFLTQVEAAVDSRPLCDMSSSPNDIEPLTPAHFL